LQAWLIPILRDAIPDRVSHIRSFCQVSYVSLRTCSTGHALLKPQTQFKPVIVLDSFARELSKNLDVQEFVEKSCSLNGYSTNVCWTSHEDETEGSKCPGLQKSYQIWATIPQMLIFDHEWELTEGKGNSTMNLLRVRLNFF